MNDNKLIYPELSYKITGVLFSVHNENGRYCNEKQYSDSIENLLRKLNIKYEREKIIPQSFEGEQQGRNKVDFLIDDKIVLEVKAKRLLIKDDYYQVKRYLAAFNKKLGLMVNFRDKYIKPRRIINSNISN